MTDYCEIAYCIPDQIESSIRRIVAPLHRWRSLVESGFWVDRTGYLALTLDREIYWIPPHRVLWVQRLNDEGAAAIRAASD